MEAGGQQWLVRNLCTRAPGAAGGRASGAGPGRAGETNLAAQQPASASPRMSPSPHPTPRAVCSAQMLVPPTNTLRPPATRVVAAHSRPSQVDT